MKKLFFLCAFFLAANISYASTLIPGGSVVIGSPDFSFDGEHVAINGLFDDMYTFIISPGNSYKIDIDLYVTDTENKGDIFKSFSMIFNGINVSDIEDTYSTVLSAGTYVLSFSGEAVDGTSKKDTPKYSYDLTATPVPVPAAVWMLGTGLVAVLGMRRKMAA